MRNPGYIVETEAGNRGRTKHSDHLVNGKIVVYLEDIEGRPLLNPDGKPKQILADRRKIKITGFVD